ncbi:hypothetical protein [Olleya sp. AS48]|uniref:hypothetical protein n=1 Tax=Olleya sp. AS48 TaxID=3135774 RepID=UPI003172AE3A
MKKIIGIILIVVSILFTFVGLVNLLDSKPSDAPIWAELITLFIFIGIGYLGIKLFKSKNNFRVNRPDWGEFDFLNLILAVVFIIVGIIALNEGVVSMQIAGFIGATKFLFSFIRGFFR